MMIVSFSARFIITWLKEADPHEAEDPKLARRCAAALVPVETVGAKLREFPEVSPVSIGICPQFDPLWAALVPNWALRLELQEFLVRAPAHALLTRNQLQERSPAPPSTPKGGPLQSLAALAHREPVLGGSPAANPTPPPKRPGRRGFLNGHLLQHRDQEAASVHLYPLQRGSVEGWHRPQDTRPPKRSGCRPLRLCQGGRPHPPLGVFLVEQLEERLVRRGLRSPWRVVLLLVLLSPHPGGSCLAPWSAVRGAHLA